MKNLMQSIRVFLVFTILLGIGYPVALTLLGQAGFPTEANGSLIERQGKLVGSRLIAQGFKEPRYFWPRASAVDYNPLPSGGSNLSGTAKALREKMAERTRAGADTSLLTASASGLDPHISPESARLQAGRVAAARNLSPAQQAKLQELVGAAMAPRFAGFLGEPTVNVLELNLAVDEAFKR